MSPATFSSTDAQRNTKDSKERRRTNFWSYLTRKPRAPEESSGSFSCATLPRPATPEGNHRSAKSLKKRSLTSALAMASLQRHSLDSIPEESSMDFEDPQQPAAAVSATNSPLRTEGSSASSRFPRSSSHPGGTNSAKRQLARGSKSLPRQQFSGSIIAPCAPHLRTKSLDVLL
jgi:hypothetical protein